MLQPIASMSASWETEPLFCDLNNSFNGFHELQEPIHPLPWFWWTLFFFLSCFTLKLKNKIHTLPDRREANEGSLKKEQKRYDHILQLAPAKEMVSLYGRRVFCSSKVIQVLISPCVSNEKQRGLSKDEAKGNGNAKVQISTNNRSTHATSSLVHFLGVFCKTTTRKEKKMRFWRQP